MILPVTDPRSNKNDQIKHAVEVLGRSKDRLKVFLAIYRGKKTAKTVSDIVRVTRLSNIRVFQEAGRLSGNGIVTAQKIGNEMSYAKDPFYATNRARILQLLASPAKLAKLAKLATKTQPRNPGGAAIVIRGLQRRAKTEQVYIEDIDSFKAVKRVDAGVKISNLSEKGFKLGIQQILGEKGQFNDWGGEKGDLLTSRLRYRGKRITTAFAFKGSGTRGVLTPRKMGKNGDQIQRLFESPAQLFILQYWGNIDGRVLEQMQGWAELTSVRSQTKILFCLIDGQDTSKLIRAYPQHFRK